MKETNAPREKVKREEENMDEIKPKGEEREEEEEEEVDEEEEERVSDGLS